MLEIWGVLLPFPMRIAPSADIGDCVHHLWNSSRMADDAHQIYQNGRKMKIRLLAVDPGKITGIAFFDLDKKELWFGAFEMDELPRILDQYACEADHVIVERWFLYPKMASKLYFSDMPGPEAIGVVRGWCARLGLKIERVSARTWKHGYKSFLEKYESIISPFDPENEHTRDAYRIGMWWLGRRLGVIPNLEDWRIRRILENDTSP